VENITTTSFRLSSFKDSRSYVYTVQGTCHNRKRIEKRIGLFEKQTTTNQP